jgi:hypothetical protein
MGEFRIMPFPIIPELKTRTREQPVKPATPDLILFDQEGIEVEIMADLLFEDIGGQELLSISRNDIINGQDVINQPIKNINDIALQYNSQNILFSPQNSSAFFNNFPIKLENYLPNIQIDEPEDPANPNKNKIVYLDNNGNLNIEVININPGYQIEVQILASEDRLSDTIYVDIEEAP